jgi:hypothetical protein
LSARSWRYGLTNDASGEPANTITAPYPGRRYRGRRPRWTANWAASAASTVFTGAGLSVSDDVLYTNGTLAETGTSTVAPVTSAASMDADPAVAVATATAVSGSNTASWNPTLDVLMPAGALAGDYAGTVTTSLA